MNYNKIYYENNKEHIKKLVRDRYKIKKDEINKKITCPCCDRIVINRMYKKHLNTNIHKKGKIERNNNIIKVPEFPVITSKIKRDGWIDFK
tara:strand:+ start:198 stop:470 length:273 start_codon:yes stop_codon:yes gene_type:complete